MNDMAKREPIDAIESLVIEGDLSKLNAEQRVQYYHRLCESLGLNPMTRPFEYLRLSGKLVLYARKDCTEQLRRQRHVAIREIKTQTENGIYTAIAHAEDGDGRTDEDMGAVPIDGLKGEALANALMKAVTKAKRRVTLSICGLGFLDESEVDSIPGAQRVPVETVELEAPEEPEEITFEQAHELLELISQVRPDDRGRDGLMRFLDFMSNRLGYQLKALGNLPASHYEVGVRTLKNNIANQDTTDAAKKAKEEKGQLPVRMMCEACGMSVPTATFDRHGEECEGKKHAAAIQRQSGRK